MSQITDEAIACGCQAVRPLYQRPVPAGQGRRPDRRGVLRSCGCTVYVDAEGRSRRLEEEIRALEADKEAAIRSEAYEKAGEIKKKQEKKREKIAKLREKWETEKTSKELVVGENEIAEVVSDWTKIPVSKLAEEESRAALKAGTDSP